MVFMQKQRMKDLLLRARVVVRTSNMKISRRHLADYVKKLHQKACRTCSTIIFLVKPIKSLICGVVVTVAVVISLTPYFSGKKTVRIKIRYLALKKMSYFWFPQGMIIFPGGVRQKRNFWRGGGVRFGSQYLENPEGRGVIAKIHPWGGRGYGYFLELHIPKKTVRTM